MHDEIINRNDILPAVQRALAAQPVTDLHTHLYSPGFGTPVANATGITDPSGLMLWGVDELVTYHYLVAEVFRAVPATRLPYEQFWKMSTPQRADHIWNHLFVERTPISEACRGVLTTLQRLGLDPNERTLEPYRKFFSSQDPGKHIDRVMEVANVRSITMTNPVFDDNERQRWLSDPEILYDPRFRAVLRIDPMLRDYPAAAKKMSEWGYDAGTEIDSRTVEEARRFLREWIDRQDAIYLAVSLPPEFRYPAEADDATARAGQAMLEKVVLPVCAEHGLPFAMMIGSRLRVNPALRDGGDMVGNADVASVVNLCREFSGNKFLVTMLARENQHELCVAARKFGNLMVFGCWWFVNNPSLIEEITRMRLELLGTSFIPQHSDARVLDQLVYKWEHSRRIIGKVLADKYADLAATGWRVTRGTIERDVKLLLADNFEDFLER
ncbi:MAG TPA: hypothetical protein VG269_17825 [Tepidisphaeraceae bacterium]|jgi:hypothetical protein|nr:hypothetical protein [Tepidisphaeraceae bacterium]